MNGPSFNLGVSGYGTTSDSSFHLGVGGTGMTSDSPFHLGVGGSDATPASFFDVSSGSDLNRELNGSQPLGIGDFLNRTPPRAEGSIGSLTKEMGAKFIPIPGLETLNTAAGMGEILHDGIKQIQAGAESGAEGVICKTARVATEAAFNAVATGVVVEGSALLIVESVAFPPLAAAIPVAAAALPQAYANMTDFAKFAGEKAGKDCHTLFRGF